MKITDTTRLCSVALKSFDETIAPELTSPAAVAAADFIRAALKAAARRGSDSAAELADVNRRGEGIADEMHEALSAFGIDVPSGPAPDGRSDADYEGQRRAHGELSARLAAAVATFSRKVPAALRAPSHGSLLRRVGEWEAHSVASFGNAPPPADLAPDPKPLPREALEAFIQRVHADGVAARISSLDRVNGGFGKQTYLLTVINAAGAAEPLVVRKEDKVMLCDHRSFDLAREFSLVKAVHRTGFPAPKPLWFGRDVPGIDAAFYVMERVAGSAAGSFLGGAAALPESLAMDFAAQLARLHQLPLAAMKDVIEEFEDPAVFTETVEQGYRRLIADWRHYAETADTQPSPMLAFLFDWLESHVPRDEGRPVLVHGDYSIHNVLAQDGAITGVLDWEAAMFGAPGIDLAYVQLALGKVIDWPSFVRHYRACGGPDVDPATLNFHLTFQATRIMLTMIRAQHLVITGRMSDIRLTSFELAFLPQFMQMALSSTAAP